jgi:hypothetical protein
LGVEKNGREPDFTMAKVGENVETRSEIWKEGKKKMAEVKLGLGYHRELTVGTKNRGHGVYLGISNILIRNCTLARLIGWVILFFIWQRIRI